MSGFILVMCHLADADTQGHSGLEWLKTSSRAQACDGSCVSPCGSLKHLVVQIFNPYAAVKLTCSELYSIYCSSQI